MFNDAYKWVDMSNANIIVMRQMKVYNFKIQDNWNSWTAKTNEINVKWIIKIYYSTKIKDSEITGVKKLGKILDFQLREKFLFVNQPTKSQL